MVNKIFYWFKDIIKGTDKLLLGLCLILSCFGILMVYSATRVKLTENAIISRDAKTMIIAIVMGILLCLIVFI